jgi:transposase
VYKLDPTGQAFGYFGGVPRTILYDNTKLIFHGGEPLLFGRSRRPAANPRSVSTANAANAKEDGNAKASLDDG